MLKQSFLFLPIVIGALVVVQTGLNEIVTKKIGASQMLVVNGLSFLGFSIVLLALHEIFISENFHLTEIFSGAHSWMFICGCLGVGTVMLGALSFNYLGACATTILILLSQLLFSLLWDVLTKGAQVDFNSIGSLILVALGATAFVLQQNQ